MLSIPEKTAMAAIASSMLLLCFVSASAADSFEDMAARAWSEYSFKEIDKAQRLFSEAGKMARTKREKCESLAGLAFCLQFGKRNNVSRDDYRRAVSIYDEALSLLDKTDDLRPFFLSMKAEALMHLSKLSPQESESQELLGKAAGLWRILDDEYGADVFRQDSLLTRAAHASDDFKDENSLKAHAALKDYVAGLDKKDGAKNDRLLASVMCSQVAEHSFLNGDFDATVEYLKAYCEFGPTSFPMKADAYFRIARIAELKTNDRKTAVEFYRRFYSECNANEKSFFAKTRAEELSGEKIGSGGGR